MSTVRVDTLVIPGSPVGPENPLPCLARTPDPHHGIAGGDDPEMAANMQLGHVPNPLPYRLQDGYDRRLVPMEFQAVVLENEHLRAVFLPQVGGRLYSLRHLRSGRELFYVNPVFRPVNFAIRNAWWSGGVEWNIGLVGHSPLTCSPLFAGIIPGPVPVLRMWEYERIRGVPFSVEAFLPDGSEHLFIKVRIVNPHGAEVPMYWWSNAAVRETARTRVIAPARSAWSFGYGPGGIEERPIPVQSGVDVSYPANANHAADYFFNIPAGTPSWEAAFDDRGDGTFMTSTTRLRGRKLFVWGRGPGGLRWQEFLSGPGVGYAEIQTGIARTQMEQVPMPARTCWTWVEAYGGLHEAPEAVQGGDWQNVVDRVGRRVATLAPPSQLADWLARSEAWQDRPVVEIITRGSAWGALEARRREAEGLAAFPPGLSFPGTGAGPESSPWLELLEHNRFEPAGDAVGFMVAEPWRRRLAALPGLDGNASALLHLGVMAHYAGDRAAARRAWERSAELSSNPVTLRNLAFLAGEEGDPAASAEGYCRALTLDPGLLPLAVECGTALLATGRARKWMELLPDLPAEVRARGRIRFLEAKAEFSLGNLDRAEALLGKDIVIDDLREGENVLSALWLEIARARGMGETTAVPAHLDYRMKT